LSFHFWLLQPPMLFILRASKLKKIVNQNHNALQTYAIHLANQNNANQSNVCQNNAIHLANQNNANKKLLKRLLK